METALQLLPATPARVSTWAPEPVRSLALAAERPQWQVSGVDRIEAAVALAERNRLRLGLGNAHFARSDWFAEVTGSASS